MHRGAEAERGKNFHNQKNQKSARQIATWLSDSAAMLRLERQHKVRQPAVRQRPLEASRWSREVKIE